MYNNARGVTVKTVISGLESITILKYIIQWPQGTTVHVSRAQTLLVYFNMVSYGGHNSGAKALTDHPYSVILKQAKNRCRRSSDLQLSQSVSRLVCLVQDTM